MSLEVMPAKCFSKKSNQMRKMMVAIAMALATRPCKHQKLQFFNESECVQGAHLQEVTRCGDEGGDDCGDNGVDLGSAVGKNLDEAGD